MAELFIFSPDDELLTIITEDTGLISAPVRIEINQVSDTPFSFTVEAESEEAAYVKEENKVVYRDHEGDLRIAVIKEIDDSDGADGPLTEAICEPEFLELNEHVIEDRRFVDKTAQEALDAALDGTRYTGEVEVELGLATTNFYYITALEALAEILNVWGGEFKDVVEFDEQNNITSRKIKIIQRLGKDTGQRFEIDHNINEIGRTVISYPLTAMYGRGASLEIEDEDGNHTGGYSRYIDFADVEWKKSKGDPVDKPLGQKWVGDPDALEKYGRWHNGKLLHRTGIFSNQDYEDPADLLMATWQHLQDNNKPVVNYRLSVDLFDDKVSLGDTAIVIDRNFARPIEIQSRVIAMEYDLLDIDGTMVVEMGQHLNLHDDRLDNVINEVERIKQRPARVTRDSFPDRKPPRPVNVQAVGAFQTIQLYWDFADTINIKHYEVYGSQVADFVPDSQHLLWRGQVSAFAHTVDTDETWYYYVRAVNYHGTPSDWSARVDASTVRIINEDILFGEIVAEHLADNLDIADKLAQNTIDRINESPMQEIQYTKEQIDAVHDALTNRIETEIGDVNEVISGLRDTSDGLISRTDTIEQALEEYDDKFTQFELDVDEIERRITLNIEEIDRIDEAVEANTLVIDAVAKGLNARINAFRYQYDEDKTGILSSIEANTAEINALANAIELRVTKQEYQTEIGDITERIAETEATLNVHAEMIETKVGRTELNDYVDKQTYTNEYSEIAQTVNNISSIVQSTVSKIDNITGEITGIKTSITEVTTDVNGITTTVSNLNKDLNSAKQAISKVEQTSNGLTSAVSSIQTDISSLEGDMNAVQTRVNQLPDEINLAVSEGIDGLEIGGRNLVQIDSFRGWSDGFTRDGYVFTLKGPKGGIRFPNILKSSTEYVMSFRTKKISGTVTHLSGHSGGMLHSTTKVYRDGELIHSGNWSTSIPYPNDTEEHLYEVYFKTTSSNITDYIYIQPNRSHYSHDYTMEIWDVKIEEGNVATGWTPAPEDQVNKTNVLSSINLSTEGVRIQGKHIHLTGQTLIDDGIIGTAAIADAAISRAKLGRAIINDLHVDEITGNKIRANTINADHLNVTNLSAISSNLGTVRAGRLLSNNNNMDLNLNTGNLTMRNADFKLGNGANIEFTSRNNRLFYTNNNVYAGIQFDQSLGQTTNPMIGIGVSDGSHDVNDRSFRGIRIHSLSAEGWDNERHGVNIISQNFRVYSLADLSGSGFEFRLHALSGRRGIFPVKTGSYTYDLGRPNNRWNDVYLNRLRTGGDGALIIRDSAGNGGYRFDTRPQNDGYNTTFRGESTRDNSYNIGNGTHRFSYIYLKYNPNVSSDERLKEDISDNTLGLEFIKELKTNVFRMKPTGSEQGKNSLQFGVIAQNLKGALINHGIDVNDINLLTQSEEGYYGVQYEQLIAPTIRAVQELDDKVISIQDKIDNRINDLKEEVTWLKTENQILKNEIKILKEKMA